MGDCIFCKIISGQIKSQILHQDDTAIAFKDLNPQAPTHVLIVPRKHIPCLAASGDGDELLLGHLQHVARDLARTLGVEAAFRLVTNNGRGAGQTVDHLHYHMLGGRRMTWPPG